MTDEAVAALSRLAQLMALRDEALGCHGQRTGALGRLLARAVGLEQSRCGAIELAGTLHDVGKIGIKDAILLKPGPLLPEEREVIESHTRLGAGMLRGGTSPLVHLAHDIARDHHERWDGLGYPTGARGGEVCIEARIVGIVEAYDAMRTCAYSAPRDHDQAVEELRLCASSQFDPELVEHFAAIQIEAIEAIYAEVSDPMVG